MGLGINMMEMNLMIILLTLAFCFHTYLIIYLIKGFNKLKAKSCEQKRIKKVRWKW